MFTRFGMSPRTACPILLQGFVSDEQDRTDHRRLRASVPGLPAQNEMIRKMQKIRCLSRQLVRIAHGVEPGDAAVWIRGEGEDEIDFSLQPADQGGSAIGEGGLHGPVFAVAH